MDVANVISILVMIALVLIAAFYRFSIKTWTACIGGALVVLTLFSHASWWLLLIFWVPFILIAAIANFAHYRQRYLLVPALQRLKTQLPTISRTEREAIEAGNVWWEKELFSGEPDWQQLFAIAKPRLTEEEINFLNNQVETLCRMLNDWDIVTKDHDLSPEVWAYLKAEKFFGLCIPKAYGGLGFSALAHSTIVIKIASSSVSAAVNTMVPNSLGPAELLMHYGTEAQKNYYLPRLASGVDVPCFALTSPEAGSDAGAMPDTGIICKREFEGQEVLGICLNFDKRYITLAPVATVVGLAIHLYDPDHLIGEQLDVGITLCLIPRNHPGVEIGARHLPMQLAFMNGPVRGKDVFIPMDWIIGGPENAGEGWRMLMECLSIGRSISLPALSTACGKGAYRFTSAYAAVRNQFNTPIASFEGIEEALANIAGYTYMLEASRIMTAGAVDMKIKPAIASAIAKYHMTELSRKIVDHCMDIHAGHAIQSGPRNMVANVYTAVPISITVEGANILTRNLIIFGQGAIRCHPYLLKEVALISAPDTDVPALDQVLMSHVGFFIRNLLRTFAYGISGGKLIQATLKHTRLKKLQRQLTRMSAALALLADTSLILLGGSLKRRERISARLGDILSQLYIASAVLKYYVDQGQPKEDVDTVAWALQYCLYKMQTAVQEICQNFPMRFLGHVLNWLIFPWGYAYQMPSDRLCKKVVGPMLEASALRDRLTQYCYSGGSPDDIRARLEKAFAEVHQVNPLFKKLRKMVKTEHWQYLTFDEQVRAAVTKQALTDAEAHQLLSYHALRNEIIKVDEFSFDLETVLT